MDFPLIMPDRHRLATSIEAPRKYNLGGVRQSFQVEAEYIDLDRAAPEEIADLCMDSDAAKKASAVCLYAHKHGADCKPPEEAVYIIAPPSRDACKVGIAKNPAKRLASLQTSHWEDLELCGLFWCLHEGNALALEQASHKAAKSINLHARGEWFRTSPEMMALVVATAAKGLRTRVADSMMWMRQREAIRWQLRWLESNQEPSWAA